MTRIGDDRRGRKAVERVLDDGKRAAPDQRGQQQQAVRQQFLFPQLLHKQVAPIVYIGKDL